MSIVQSIRQLRKTPFYKSNLWEIIILPPEDPLVRSSLKSDDNLSLYAKNVSIPYDSISYERDIVQNRDFITGLSSPDELTISFYESELLEVTRYLQSLRDAIYTKDRQVRWLVNPTIEIIVILQKFKKGLEAVAGRFLQSALTVGGVSAESIGFEFDPLESIIGYKFKNVLYKSRNELSLDYENGDFTTIDATFSVGSKEDLSFVELQAFSNPAFGFESPFI